MIELSAQDIGEFKALFKRETGKDITNAEARKYAMSVLRLVALVVQPESLSSEHL